MLRTNHIGKNSQSANLETDNNVLDTTLSNWILTVSADALFKILKFSTHFSVMSLVI